MFALQLYEKYLENSIEFANKIEKERKLTSERKALEGIIAGMDTLFQGDSSLLDKEDHSIYTFIKREILNDALHGNVDAIVHTSRFFLNRIVNQIDAMRAAIA